HHPVRELLSRDLKRSTSGAGSEARSGPAPDPARVREIHRRLARRFGPLDPPRRLDPLEELILTVLSQNTSDVNRDRAYASLRERFGTWDALAAARPEEIADAISLGVLANSKAPRSLAIARALSDRE